MSYKKLIIILAVLLLGGGVLAWWRFGELKEGSDLPEEKVIELGELLNVNSKLKEFFEKTREKNPNLELGQFVITKSELIKTNIIEFPFPPKSEEDPLWTFSPDKEKAISTLAYFGEPDSSLDIYNRNNDGKVERLQFCGTPCVYWGTFWLSNEQFVFIQSSEYHPLTGEVRCTVDTICTYLLSISLYDLTKNIETVHQSQELKERPISPIWPEWTERIEKIQKR